MRLNTLCYIGTRTARTPLRGSVTFHGLPVHEQRGIRSAAGDSRFTNASPDRRHPGGSSPYRRGSHRLCQFVPSPRRARPQRGPPQPRPTQEPTQIVCSQQAAWNQRGGASVKALYADAGALSADASANNPPAVTNAGKKLTSDAIAAATLPLPPVDPGSWKTLTADFAAAGTDIAGGDASGAVPQLEAGNSAIGAFSARLVSARA